MRHASRSTLAALTGCVLLLLAPAACGAQAQAQAHSQTSMPLLTAAPALASDALPEPVGVARDADFGVGSHHFALQRRVWMWQWQTTPAGVQGSWSEQLLPSPDATHRNPARWPLPAQEWQVQEMRLAGQPIAEGAVRALGAWHALRPSFDALSPNMAATFQPEGDGLGTADDPQHPAIGDLHVAWREWRLPPLAGRVQLDGNEWRLRPAAGITPAVAVADTPAPNASSRHLAWLLGAGAGAGVAVLALALLLRRRTRSRRR